MIRKFTPKLGIIPALTLPAMIFVAMILLAMAASACSTATSPAAPTEPIPVLPSPASPVPTASATLDPALADTPAPTEDSSGSTVDDVSEAADAVASRTPVPTPTPGVVDRQIDDLTASLGLSGKTFLGLTADNWFSLVFSVLIVAAGYFLGFKILVWFLKRIAHRTSRKLDENVLKDITPDLKLLLLVIFTRFAVLRLDFLSDGLRTGANDFFFILGMVLISIIAIRLINFSLDRYIDSKDVEKHQKRAAALIKTVQRLGDFVVLVIASSIALNHFGIGTSTLAIVLLVSGVVIYLGAKGIISDLVAGFIILIDQPFRVNDAILIKEIETWGVVLDIGTRTTRIRTGDNREVIVPNSQINESQVINYTYPDSRYRVATEIGVAYGSDFDQMRKVIHDAVRGVEGVMPDKRVDIFFMKFGDTTRSVNVRWWIDSYKNENTMLDKVNAALEVALGQAGIDMPFDTYNLNVTLQDGKPDQATPGSDQGRNQGSGDDPN